MTTAPDSLRLRADSRVGTMLKDKWKLDALLGVGGMAAVYAATHRNGKRVAVKVLHAELSVEGEVRTRFLREGYAANKVEHPGAVSVLDDDIDDDGSVFLVMDLLEGESLAARAERSHGTLDPSEVLVITERLLDVLVAAHDRGLVHRDIKPENVFLTQDGGVRVLDFGIARLREWGSEGVTQSGLAMGTPAFMPPEQARGRWDEVDARSDLWAVGASMFSLLTGRHVHQADTMNEVLLAAMTLPAQPLARFLPGISPEVAKVVDRALAYDRRDRWEDAVTMQAAVRAAYETLRGEPVSTAPRIEVPRVVSPSAPTLAALPAASTRTTAGGVSRIEEVPLELRRPKRRGLGFFGAIVLAAVAAGVGFTLARRPKLISDLPLVADLRAWGEDRGLLTPASSASAPPLDSASSSPAAAAPATSSSAAAPSSSDPAAAASSSASAAGSAPPKTAVLGELDDDAPPIPLAGHQGTAHGKTSKPQPPPGKKKGGKKGH